jgi:hypothetical protein
MLPVDPSRDRIADQSVRWSPGPVCTAQPHHWPESVCASAYAEASRHTSIKRRHRMGQLAIQVAGILAELPVRLKPWQARES